MLIGIDGGGTKTALCLADNEGHILSAFTGEGTNPADIGLEECAKRLKAQLDALLDGFGGRTAPIDSVYAGIAGSANKYTSTALRKTLTELLPNASCVDNGSDAYNALYGESSDGCGITLIAGTGSSSFVVTEEGTRQIGGWGYLIDDAGSGFWVGKQALKAAYRAFDGRGPKTLLMEKCADALGTSFGEAIPKIYEGGKHYIASFARIAFAAMQEGDAVAAEIIRSAASELAEHLRAGLRHVRRLPVVCAASGGLISNDAFFQMIKDALGEDLSKFNLLRPEVPQVYGALAKAARNARVNVDQRFREHFMDEYK